MKTIATFSKTLILLVLTLTISCSSDDDASGTNPMEPEQSQGSSIVTFSGGPVDGLTHSIPVLTNYNSVFRTQEANQNTGTMDDFIFLNLSDLENSNYILNHMQIKMNGNHPVNFSENDKEHNDQIIMIGNYEMKSISGTINITEYGQDVYGGLIFPYFKMTYNVHMKGEHISDINYPSFTTTASGTVVVGRKTF